MISTAVKNPVQTNFESTAFSIKVSGKAFDILINALYSDKVGAVVRELCANAWDAHIQRGNPDQPFEITLPSSLNPVFKVRDFGVSMDHETIMNRYSTLFDSTKDDSNEVVGMLGIGSKSPFAYVTTFGLRAVLDGVANTYIVHLDSEGIPQIAQVDSSPTDDEQGFEVSVAVKPGDFHTFENAWNKVALGFVGRTQPTVLGNETLGIETLLVSANGWVVVSGAFERYAPTIMVRQGCVVYPTRGASNGNDKVRVVIDVPIGTCSITANRESLAWDPHTTDFVDTAQRQALRGIETAVLAIVDAETDTVERAKLAQVWGTKMGDISSSLTRELNDRKSISLVGFPLKSAHKDGVVDRSFRYGGDRVPNVVYKYIGTKDVIREKVRIRLWARVRNGQYNKVNLVAEFSSELERDLFTKMTGVVPFPMTALEDPGPAPRAKKGAVTSKIVDGAYWTVARRGKLMNYHASPESYAWKNIRSRYPDLLGPDVVVMRFTPGEVKTLKLPADRNYLDAVQARIHNDTMLHETLVSSYIAQKIAARAISGHASTGLKAIAGVDTADQSFARDLFPWDASKLDQAGLEERATRVVNALYERFPMLDRNHTLTPAEIDVILQSTTTTMKEES